MPKTVTPHGSAKLSTGNPKFGPSAGLFANGTGDYLTVTDGGDMEPGSGDFTIEFWLYLTSTSRQALYHGSNGQDFSLAIDYNSVGTNKLGIWASTNGTSWNLINSDGGGNGLCGTVVTQNAWHHVAYVRNGTTWKLYLDGVADCTVTSASGTVANAGHDKVLGRWFNDGAMNFITGNLDEWRFSNTARWTSNFTPASSAYTNDANTKLLLHMDGADASTTFTDSSGTYTSTLTESTTLSVSLIRSMTRALAESLTMADVLMSLRVKLQTLSDSLSMADSVNRGVTRLLGESATFTDSLARQITHIGAEAITLTANVGRTMSRAFTESVSLLDFASKFVNGLLNIYSDKYSERNTTYTDKYQHLQ